MRKLALIVSIFIISISAKGQSSAAQRAPSDEELRVADPIVKDKSDEIFPAFPGGFEALKKFVTDNFKIQPNTNNIHGLIIVTFLLKPTAL